MPMTIDPTEMLTALYDGDTEKYFDEAPDTPIFDCPSVAVASADDPWFARFKSEIIGEFHWMPAEALGTVAPEATARSVISWCLPVAFIAREANRREAEIASRLWAYQRTYGEEFINRLRAGMVERLNAAGYAAVAPQMSPENEVAVRPGVGFSSRWSERHTAFVAGLGTFGIHGGLITARGVAHRLGSVVTDAELTPTPRPYGDDAFAWCLRTSRGLCGACIKRCPAGSVGESVAERNKDACFQHTYERVRGQKGVAVYGWRGTYGCGLCQTGVPCEERNPTAAT